MSESDPSNHWQFLVNILGAKPKDEPTEPTSIEHEGAPSADSAAEESSQPPAVSRPPKPAKTGETLREKLTHWGNVLKSVGVEPPPELKIPEFDEGHVEEAEKPTAAKPPVVPAEPPRSIDVVPEPTAVSPSRSEPDAARGEERGRRERRRGRERGRSRERSQWDERRDEEEVVERGPSEPEFAKIESEPIESIREAQVPEAVEEDEKPDAQRRGRRRRRGRRGRRDREAPSETDRAEAGLEYEELDVEDFEEFGTTEVKARIETPFESGEVEFDQPEIESSEPRPSRRRRRRRPRTEPGETVEKRRPVEERRPVDEIDEDELLPRTADLLDEEEDESDADLDIDLEGESRPRTVRVSVPSWSDAISDIIARNMAARKKSGGSGGGGGGGGSARRGRGRGGRRPGPRDRS